MPAEPPVVSPTSLSEAYALLRSAGHRPLAGGTDVLVQITGEIGEVPERVLDLWRLDELRGIRRVGDALELGALTIYTDIRRSGLCIDHAPALVEASATIGAAQIQNRGTIGGNTMNASPAGDTLPVLLALDAEMIIGGSGGERTVRAVDFWPSYRQTLVRPDELLLRIRIPIVSGRQQRFRKVGTRRAQAISKVVMALAWREDSAVSAPGDRGWRDVRLALGSVAPTPIRASTTEAILEGAAPTKETANRAVEALTKGLRPIDDVRSTAGYRKEVAGRVLRRVIREAGGW